jgi:hypothetical protein
MFSNRMRSLMRHFAVALIISIPIVGGCKKPVASSTPPIASPVPANPSPTAPEAPGNVAAKPQLTDAGQPKDTTAATPAPRPLVPDDAQRARWSQERTQLINQAEARRKEAMAAYEKHQKEQAAAQGQR